MKLAPEKQITLSEVNLAGILSRYDIAAFTFEPLTKGIENTSALIMSEGKKFVLRVYMQGRKVPADILEEIAFMVYLRAGGIPVPEVYANTTGSFVTSLVQGETERHSILMEYVAGETGVPYTSELIQELSALQARMHILGSRFAESAPHAPSWKELREGYAGGIPREGLGAAELGFLERASAFRYLLNEELPCGFNHLDIDLDGNTIVYENKVAAIIDFDDTAYTPHIVCLANTLFEVLLESSEEDMWDYLAYYEVVRPLSDVERDALPYCLLFRNYVMGVFNLLLWKNQDEMAEILRLESYIQTPSFGRK